MTAFRAEAARVEPTPARGRPRRLAGLLVLALVLPAFALTWADALALLPAARWLTALTAPDLTEPAELLARHAFAPRLLVALLAGGALALAGAILQQALRNPLADPTTIGASAGAGLALAAATLFAPALLEHGREGVAFAGSVIAATAALGIAARTRFSPVTLILAGLIVSLMAGSATALLMVLNTDYVAEVFVWQSGSLAQIGDGPTLRLGLCLALACAAVTALARPLELLRLGDETAAALGLPPWGVRGAALLVALALSATVAAAVGVIAFVGLAAPALVRLVGVHRFGERAFWSVLVGACLLWLTDRVALRLPFPGDIPAGSLTALLGAPLLFALLPRREVGAPSPPPSRTVRVEAGRFALPTLALATAVALAAALLLGRSDEGWSWSAAAADGVMPLRLPRVLAAGAAGALLGVAGTILQRITGNPIAAPEMVGAPAGATIGILALFTLTAGLDPWAVNLAAAAGSLGAILVVMAIARGTGFRSERWLLAGVAISTLGSGMAAVALASGDPRVGWLQARLIGSSYAATLLPSALTLAAALAALGIAWAAHRWLSMIALGPVAASLGVPERRATAFLLTVAALATASATVAIGPLSFVGLIAPHAAASLGFRRTPLQLTGAALIGAFVLVVADWVGRTVIYPWQVPATLIACLAGGLYVLFQLARQR